MKMIENRAYCMGAALAVLGMLALFAGRTLAAEVSERNVAIERHVAIKDVCAWPNLTVLPDGSVAAVIHNKPSHGQMAGDVDCWVTRDGLSWEKRGNPAPNEPHTVRMNLAAGLAKNGDLLVLCSGWTNIEQPPRPKQAKFRDDILRTWTCRSSDSGRTWTHHTDFPAPDEGWSEYIPFGDVVVGHDGALHVPCYGGEFADPNASTKTKGWRSWHFTSDDDGKSWRRTSVIGPKHNETHFIRLGEKSWLAAARIDAVELFRSDDDGLTWTGPQRVTGRNEINGHLLRLDDGRLLLSYGNRVAGQFGVMARLSSDEGQTWSEPLRLAETNNSDCGYPSSVQLADGRILTAYYAKGSADYDGYFMGVALWRPSAK
jgi:hypothetical protein